MAIKLIVGNTFSSVSKRVYEEIKANDDKVSRNVLFVPDQFALMSEMEVLDYLDIVSSFNIEVASFSRFAVKTLKKRSNYMLNPQTSVMLLKKIILENKDRLVCYKNVYNKSGYISEIYAVIANFRNSKVTPNMLKESLTNLKGYLKQKLEDIILLYELYLEKLVSEYSDIGSELEILASEIQNIEGIASTNIYATDFHELTKVKLDILANFIKHAKNFTIGVVDNEGGKNSKIYPHYLAAFVSDIAKENDLPIEIIKVEEKLSKEKREISNRLFSYYQNTDIKDNTYVDLRIADNKTCEVRGIARYIRKLIVDDGYRYKDIAVVVNDIASYKDIIFREFTNFDLPYYLDDKVALSMTSISKLLLQGYKVVEKNYKKSEVINFSKNVLLPIDRKNVAIFENFVIKYNINYNDFKRVFEKGEGDKNYTIAESVREQIIDILSCLDSSMDSVQDMVKCVNNFIEKAIQNNYENYINDIAKVDKKMAKVSKIALEKIELTMEQLTNIFENVKINKKDAFDLFFTSLDNIEISAIPQSVDSIFIGDESKSKLFSVKVLFLVGAGENTYPTISDGSGMLSYDEYTILSKKGVEIFPDFKGKMHLDQFYVLQLLLKAQDKVVISYSSDSGDMSVMFKQLQKILNITPIKFIEDNGELNRDIDYYSEKISTRKNAVLELLNYQNQRIAGISIQDEGVYDYLYTYLKDELMLDKFSQKEKEENINLKEPIYREKQGKRYASISSVEKYFGCPFTYYCDNILKLKKNPTGEIDIAQTGSLVHRVLEIFFTDYNKNNITLKEVDRVVDSILDSVLKEEEFAIIKKFLDEKTIQKLLYEKCRYVVKKAFACTINSDFEVEFNEYSFGMNDRPAYEINVDNDSYYIRGKIDRVDRYNDYVAIIDYKSKKSVDIGLKNVFYGERLQLLMYANALSNNEKVETFAVYYLPMDYSYKNLQGKEGKENYNYQGFTRGLEDIISHFDYNYDNSNRSVPSVFSGKKFDSKKVLDKKDMEILQNYVNKVVYNAIKEIESGYIAPRPLDNCDYCEYGDICMSKGKAKATRPMVKNIKVKEEENND